MAAILTADRIQTVSGSALSTNWPSGMIIGSKCIRNGTRTAMPTTNAYAPLSGTYTKILGSTQSKLVCRLTAFYAGYNSGSCGAYIACDSTKHYGTGYQYDGSWSSTQQTTVVFGQAEFTGIAAGNRTISHGWNTANGSTSDKIGNYFNPNSNDDSRNQQMISSITVFEVVI